MSKYTYRPGEWNAQCDCCGRRFPASQLRQRWDGVMVCKDDFETRHPQELIRPVIERNNLPFTRPVNWTVSPNTPTYLDNGSTVPGGTFDGGL